MAQDDLSLDPHFGDYDLLGQIGAGGMGRVYRAVQRRVERDVAIKVLPKALAQEVGFAERFAHEARILAALRHAHILPIYDYGQAQGHWYIAMPLVEGGDLRSELTGKPLPLNRLRKIAMQLAEGLSYAHRQGVVHRDMKPANVLMDVRGYCLLCDFGIAEFGDRSQEAVVGYGSMAYMAPEQAMGVGSDARSDQYSLAVMLYELGTGAAPFVGPTALDVAQLHASATPKPPRQRNPELPAAFETALLRALEKDPADRFATTDEFTQALGAALPREWG